MSERIVVKSFGAEADAFLAQCYADNSAQTVQEKIEFLEGLMGKSAFYGQGGDVTPEMKLGCYEYDFLESEGMLTRGIVFDVIKEN